MLVAVHGTLVAIMNTGPHGLWPMFCFGFLAIFVITQMHGVGLSRAVRWVIGIGYVVAAFAVYTWRGLVEHPPDHLDPDRGVRSGRRAGPADLGRALDRGGRNLGGGTDGRPRDQPP